MSQPRIVISGLGMVSALGWDPATTWQALLGERSGLGPLRLFPSPECGAFPVAEVAEDPHARTGLRRGSRSDALALWAARQAFSGAGLGAREHTSTGCVLGASTGGMFDSEGFLLALPEGGADFEALRNHEPCCSTDTVARDLRLGGPRATVSTACASGAMAIALGADLIRSRRATRVLAGGVDSLTRLTLNGFCSLLAVARDGCRPFDSARQGMSLGEGAAVLVLEDADAARARAAPVLAELLGYAQTCDAHHATAPQPEGRGVLEAMRAALEMAGLEPGEVGYINAHGTGTQDNDPAEARAVLELFGPKPPPLSSTKRYFGHTLAAAGALEAAVCVLALQHQWLPANLGLRKVDPAIGLQPLAHGQPAALRVALSNSLGFGGSNCSLVLGHPEGALP